MNQATVNYVQHLLSGHIAMLQWQGESGFIEETKHFFEVKDDLLRLPGLYSEGCLIGLDCSVN